MKTMSRTLVAIAAATSLASIVACGAPAGSDVDTDLAFGEVRDLNCPINDLQCGGVGGKPGGCNPINQCCYQGSGGPSGQCLADLQAEGCPGAGPAVGTGYNEITDESSWFFDMGCFASAPKSCLDLGVATVPSGHCGKPGHLAIDPNCPSCRTIN